MQRPSPPRFSVHRVASGVALAASLCAGPAAAACYTVYDAQDRVVYRGAVPPVDMARSPADAVRARVPDGYLVFDGAADCGPLVRAPGRGVAADRPAPLYTDRETADGLALPHSTLPGGIARVDGPAAAMRPGVTVVPATRVPVAAGPTAVMGAGPTRTVVRAPPSAGTVITEMHNPPLVVVERDGWVVEVAR